MERRTFIKASAAGGVMTLVTPRGFTQTLVQNQKPALTEGFRQPPASARPHTWWHWMNGHVTAEGITADLEAMHRVGIGGFQNFFVGTGIPIGPVKYLSPEWLALMKHTIAEAGRLGLELQMHNCPGWSSSGGPWITPELSMQQVVWSETFVRGGQPVQARLAQPLSRLGHYRDIRVLAFPSLQGETRPWHDTLRQIRVNEVVVDARPLLAGQGSGVPVLLVNNESATVTLEFSAPFRAQSLLFYARSYSASGPGASSIAPVTVEASDDGVSFRTLHTITQVGAEVPGAASFNATAARFFRLRLSRASILYQVSLSGAARIDNWVAKANFGGPLEDNGWSGSEERFGAGQRIDPATVIDVTSHMQADGEFSWNAPPGDWTVLRFGHTSTARINKAAPTTGEGLECDKYSREAFDFHFQKMFGELLDVLKPLAAQGNVGILIDSYEVGMQNWTHGFLEAFRQRRGYDLLAYLPAMTGRVVHSVDRTERVLWDLRRVQADLMADHYFGRCTELCRQYGFTSYVEPYNHGPFEQMQVGGRMDVMLGEFWIRSMHFRHSMKLAASIQHTNGRAVVAAEAYTGHSLFSKWQEHPYAMKAAGDAMFARGLNRMVFHRFAHQPHLSAAPGMTMGPWGIHFDRTITWWEQGKAWLEYLARCQFMLQRGLFVADLLYYTGADAPGADLSTRESPRPLPPQGYDYDDIGTEALLGRVSIRDRQIVLPDGMRYAVLILPRRTGMTLEVLRKLHALVMQGMALLGERPSRLEGWAGGAGSEGERERLTEALWGNAQAPVQFHRVVGQGQVFATDAIARVLAQLGVAPDFTFTARSSDPSITSIHRRDGDTEFYFVANGKRRAEDLVCSFRVQGRKPEFWDADSGQFMPAEVHDTANGRVQVPISLGSAGSVFVVFRSPAARTHIRSVSLDGKVLLSARNHAQSARARHGRVVGNFTMAAWIKPDSDIALPGDAVNAPVLRRYGIRSFVFHPPAGDALYGEGHASAGAVAGRNGVSVYERTRSGYVSVLTAITPLSGWTHVAIVYRGGVPQLYLNGKLAGEGKPSGLQVHPSIGEEYHDESAPYFEGEKRESPLVASALPAARIQAMVAEGLPQLSGGPALIPSARAEGGWLFWRNGNYVFQDSAGQSSRIGISGIGSPVLRDGPWEVAFPPNLGAPPSVRLPRLMSLHEHADPGVKYFSGTATYRRQFDLPPVRSPQRLFLDLGEVEVIAQVRLNGKDLGILWKPPFRVDITDHVKAGGNALEVQVTNLWPNRLIGDEQLPPEYDYSSVSNGQTGGIKRMPDWYVQGHPKPPGGRITFATWRHFEKDSPLLPSGLVGPVRLITAVERKLKE